jgi:Na+/H+-translocating membrane pyrophosphatase
MGDTIVHGNDVKTFFCISVGLWGGCIIGFVTEYFTSFSYNPTQVGPWRVWSTHSRPRRPQLLGCVCRQ